MTASKRSLVNSTANRSSLEAVGPAGKTGLSLQTSRAEVSADTFAVARCR